MSDATGTVKAPPLAPRPLGRAGPAVTPLALAAFAGRGAGPRDLDVDVRMIRYDAAHRGAEKDIFTPLGEGRPAITRTPRPGGACP